MFLGREAFFLIFFNKDSWARWLGRRKGENSGWRKMGMRGGYCKDHKDRDSCARHLGLNLMFQH